MSEKMNDKTNTEVSQYCPEFSRYSMSDLLSWKHKAIQAGDKTGAELYELAIKHKTTCKKCKWKGE